MAKEGLTPEGVAYAGLTVAGGLATGLGFAPALAALGAFAPGVGAALGIGVAIAPSRLVSLIQEQKQAQADRLQADFQMAVSRVMALALARAFRGLKAVDARTGRVLNESFLQAWAGRLERAAKPGEGDDDLDRLFQIDRRRLTGLASVRTPEDLMPILEPLQDRQAVLESLWEGLWPVLAGKDAPRIAREALKERFIAEFPDRLKEELSLEGHRPLMARISLAAASLQLQILARMPERLEAISRGIEDLRRLNVEGELNLQFKLENLPDRLEDRQSALCLRHEYRLTPQLTGNEEAWQKLVEFMEWDRPAAWTLLIGPAGSGKSRLAQELCQAYASQGWMVGFVSGKPPVRIPHTERNILLVIDYAGSKAESAGRLIESLGSPREGGRARILLLERYYYQGAGWARDLMGAGHSIRRTGFRGDGMDWSQKLDAPCSPIELRPLTPLEMTSIFARACLAFSGEEADERTIAKAEILFGQPLFKGRLRPIYAAGAALVALRSPEDFEGTRPDQLVDFLLDEERNLWRKRQARESHLHALVVSTLHGRAGASVGQVKSYLGEDYPREEAFFSNCHLLAGRQGDDPCLAPLEPDLLGEGFVVKRLEGALLLLSTSEEVREATRRLLVRFFEDMPAKAVGPEQGASMPLIIQDYLHRPALREFLLERDRLKSMPDAWKEILVSFAGQGSGAAQSEVLRALDEVDYWNGPAVIYSAERAPEAGPPPEASPVSVQEAEAWLERLEPSCRAAVFEGASMEVLTDLERDLDRLGQAVESLLAGDRSQAVLGLQLRAFHWLGLMRQRTGQLLGAASAFFASEAAARALAEQLGTPQSLRDLSTSLSNTADILKSQGDMTEALNRFQESLDLRRTLARQLGTPQSLRDLSVSLDNTADILKSQGDMTEALNRQQESLDLRRTLARKLGTPESLRDLSISLDNTADILKSQGDMNEALSWQQESLDLRRTLARQLETPQSLRDLSISLDNTADILLSQGDMYEALIRLQESLDLRRTLARQLGTPQSLRDLSVSLIKTGDILKSQGDMNEALNRFQESLDIARTLARQLGTPESLRDLSISLDKTGDILQSQGDMTEALNRFQESLDIARTLAEQLRTPQSLRDLSVSLDNTGDILKSQGDRDQAIERLQEAVEIMERLASSFPGVPQYQADLALVKNHLEIAGKER